MVFDRDALALDVASFAYALPKCGLEVLIPFERADIHETDNRHRRLLRPRSERPRSHRAAEKRDELAPLHAINSSARASSAGGTVRPSALAVFMLIVSSTLVDCWTGKSAGFS